MDPDLIGQSCALATAFTWACAMVLFKRSGETIKPLPLNLFKNTLGLSLLVLTLVATQEPWSAIQGFAARDFAILLISGFLGIAVADTIFFYSLNIVGVGIQSIVDCSYSPLVILFSCLMLQEVLALPDYLGAGMVLSGVLISTRHDLPPNRTRAQLLAGIALGAFSIALMALGIVLAKPVLHDFPLLWATVVRLVAGTAPLALWGLLTDRRGVAGAFRPSSAWKFALPGAFLGAYVSMILWIAGFKYTQAGIAGALNQTSTIFAILLAAAFLKERLTARKLMAVGLAMGGVILVTAF